MGWGTPPYTFTGDLVLLIDESRECSVDGAMSGTILGWGDFELRFTGTIYINVTNGALGEITITRYRAGIDTVQVTGSMAGQFDLKQVYAFGSWETNLDEAFDIEGEWGAMKKDEGPLIRY